jgi:hypothetical protein
MPDFVSYLRVSTDKQGITGLGMDAQREAVRRYVQNRVQIAAEFVEVESARGTPTVRVYSLHWRNAASGVRSWLSQSLTVSPATWPSLPT